MFKLFSRHYGTERFFIMIGLCLLMLISLTTYGGVIQHQNNIKRVAETAVYTKSYVWSRTSSKGQVVAMASDNRNTAVFLLLRNEGNTSVDAKNYQVFLTGRDQPMANSPTMTVYSFGATGYLGFYFKDAKGFENMVYSMIVRDNSAASDMANENTFDPNAEQDKSFQENNQIRLYLNFGASGVEKLPVMDMTDLTPLKIMADMPIDPSKLEGGANPYRGAWMAAQNNLADMSADMIEIAQLRDSLKQSGVRVPSLPYYIAGDRIDTTPNDFSREVTSYTEAMLDGDDVSSSGTTFFEGTEKTDTGDASGSEPTGNGTFGNGAQYDANPNGETPDMRNFYYLHTDYLYPGTVHFTWQGRRMSQGLISQLPDFMAAGNNNMNAAYGAYAAWKEETSAQAAAMPSKVAYESWRMADGSYVDMSDSQGGNAVTAAIPNMCRQYEDAVNSYLAHKKAYFEKLDNILRLENNVQVLSTVVTSNNGSASKNLWIY